LNELGHDSNIRKEFDKILNLRKECEDDFDKFGQNMELFIKELESGIPLKGKCEPLGY
jgi:hypothetical protein